ncbi:Fic family protein, partial [bacterium]|nr:Fic family protein [bacterium]
MVFIMKIGKYIQQSTDYKAFILNSFPPEEGISFSVKIQQKESQATRLLGKLDGVTQILPNIDFFLFMYIRKDAAASSQIEGTKATMLDAIEAEAHTSNRLPADVDDIMHYIKALNYGLERLKDFPLSLRFITELHKELMDDGARSSHFSYPGEFRRSQNWIGGTTPSNALFVPPPVPEMKEALSDLEKFMHAKEDFLPLIKTALLHAQFETIHPFADGNGRTGRLLITLFLWLNQLIDRPILFLSSYFKKHQKVYYSRLDSYHNGDIEKWMDFFLDGIIETSELAIITVKEINQLREEDMRKIQSLGKEAAESGIKVLRRLFSLP